MQIEITSPAFSAGETIPRKYTGEGEDISPELRWSALPPGAKELAVICDDPDSPGAESWVHWLAYKIPASVPVLAEGIASRPGAEMLQGRNSWGASGWRGPFPPKGHGRHRYDFSVYVLDESLKLKSGMDKAALLAAMQGHVIAAGKLEGVYER